MASQIDLPDDFVYYFGLYLVKKEEKGDNSSKKIIFMPPLFLMRGHIGSSLSVRPVHAKNGFMAISFEHIGVLDSYFITGI